MCFHFIVFFVVLLFCYSCQSGADKAPPFGKNASVVEKGAPAVAIPKDTMPVVPAHLVFTWKENQPAGSTVFDRIRPPAGFERIPMTKGSFGEWLRYLPLKEEGAAVHLYNGQLKDIQSVHHAVVDIDTGTKNLQQCADAVMRLRAEYHFSRKDFSVIHFNYTSGDEVSFDRWRKGERPVVQGNKVRWKNSGRVSDDYPNFKSYLQQIFTYAGTASLTKELLPADIREVQPGDVFIQGGFPGHAVLVLDVATNEHGKRLFLLGQSYMPAQEFHILKNPTNETISPWYDADIPEVLQTPEWTFRKSDLRRWEE